MKKITYKAMVLAMALVLALAAVAQADTIVSPVYKFSAVQERPTEAPTVEPTAEPTAEPEVTAEPVAEPEVTEVPAEEPTVTEEPAATEEPVDEPEAEEPATETEVPAEESVDEPEAEPLPEPTVYISSNLEGKRAVRVGTEMVLTMTVENAAGRAYTIQWQQSSDNGATWEDIPGANAEQFTLALTREHVGMLWRVTIDIEDAAANE